MKQKSMQPNLPTQIPRQTNIQQDSAISLAKSLFY
jgi:hypothetical protein